MATHNDPDHHDVFPGGRAGREVNPVPRVLPVTQADIDDVLRRAGLPTSLEEPTIPAPPETFCDHAIGLEIYVPVIDPRGYLRAPIAVHASLLTHPLY